MTSLPNLTPAALRALEAAQDWAGRLGAAEVQPEHLLRGLLDEEEGSAALVLIKIGVDLAGVRKSWMDFQSQGNQAVDVPPSPALPNALLPLNSRTQDILHHARLLTSELSADRTVASEHLLLASIQRDEPLRRHLERYDLEVARLEAEIRATQEPKLKLDEPLHLPQPAEEIDTARILDAAANRAREALRVLEDYCRFVLDDTFLSRELKSLRHALADVLAALPVHFLLESRETLRDVGTGLSPTLTPPPSVSPPDPGGRYRGGRAGWGERHTLQEVVLAGCKRLQEALRSLEEFGKMKSPALGEGLEKLRYRSYTLEKALVLGSIARQRLADVELCVIVTGSLCAAALDWTIKEAVAGGAGMIQLREKDLPDRELLERSRQVRRWTKEVGALLIINDRPDIARLAEADGVHVGQDDLPVKEARRILGPDGLIGVSTHNLDQVRQAIVDGASYIGVGPTFSSGTKEFAELAGVDFVRQVVAETRLPAFVIGGVTPENVEPLVAAGARRIAVSQAICQAKEPRQVAAELRRMLG